MDFQSIVKSRYATKKFTGEKISEEKINELLELIRLSASSFGLQPYKILVVTNDELKSKLQEHSWNQPQITSSSHLLVFCAFNDVDARIDKYREMMLEAGMPAERADGYIGMMKGFAEGLTSESAMNWASKQAYIAVGNAINGSKALGFDSCPMEGFDPVKYKELLELDSNLTPVCLVPVGVAADEMPGKIRFAKEDLFISK